MTAGTGQDSLSCLSLQRYAVRGWLRMAPPSTSLLLGETLGCLEGQRRWLGEYAVWREAGYPIGSDCVERAVTLVINRRLKKRGMRWCRHNANGLVALRVHHLNGGWGPTPPPPHHSLPNSHFVVEPRRAAHIALPRPCGEVQRQDHGI